MSAWWGLVWDCASLNVTVKLQRAQRSHIFEGYWCIMQTDTSESLLAFLQPFYTNACGLQVSSSLIPPFSLIATGTVCVPPPTCSEIHSGPASWNTFPVTSCRIKTPRCATLWSRRTKSRTSLSAKKTTHSTTSTVKPQCELSGFTWMDFTQQMCFIWRGCYHEGKIMNLDQLNQLIYSQNKEATTQSLIRMTKSSRLLVTHSEDLHKILFYLLNYV